MGKTKGKRNFSGKREAAKMVADLDATLKMTVEERDALEAERDSLKAEVAKLQAKLDAHHTPGSLRDQLVAALRLYAKNTGPGTDTRGARAAALAADIDDGSSVPAP